MKRGAPLKRVAFRSKREGPSYSTEPKPRAEAAAPTFKPRLCDWEKCGKTFTPSRPMQTICSQRCATARANAQVAERKAAERQKDRAQREAQKGYWTLVGEAQDAFNAFIRERDKDAGCFVCDAPFEHTSGSLGGVMDAGHVRTRAAAPHLRFHEKNCHGECKHCNGSFGAKPHEIEAGAIRRIGQESYDALVSDNTPRKWTRDELRVIRDEYRVKLRDLKKQREGSEA